MKISMAMVLSLAAAACGGDGADNGDGGAAPAARVTGSAGTGQLDDDQIAALVGLINGVEAASAKAVEPKLTLPSARAFARTLLADHTRLMAAMPTFRGPAIPPPQAHGMNAVFRSQASMLSTLPSGTPFDATFAAIQIADHAMAIDSLRRWHGAAEDQALRTAIARALPVMEAHLAQAQGIYAALDVGASPGAPSGSPPRTTRPDTSRADTVPVDTTR